MKTKELIFYTGLMVSVIIIACIPALGIIVGTFLVGLCVLGVTTKMLYKVNTGMWDRVHNARKLPKEDSVLNMLPDIYLIQSVLLSKGAMFLYVFGALLIVTALILKFLYM